MPPLNQALPSHSDIPNCSTIMIMKVIKNGSTPIGSQTMDTRKIVLQPHFPAPHMLQNHPSPFLFLSASNLGSELGLTILSFSHDLQSSLRCDLQHIGPITTLHCVRAISTSETINYGLPPSQSGFYSVAWNVLFWQYHYPLCHSYVIIIGSIIPRASCHIPNATADVLSIFGH